jgi:hypothetical protein
MKTTVNCGSFTQDYFDGTKISTASDDSHPQPVKLFSFAEHPVACCGELHSSDMFSFEDIPQKGCHQSERAGKI